MADTIGSMTAVVRATSGLFDKDIDAIGNSLQKMQKDFADLSSRGASITSQMRRPVEVYRDTMKELRTLLQAGAIDLKTFDRAAGEAFRKFNKDSKPQGGGGGMLGGLIAGGGPIAVGIVAAQAAMSALDRIVNAIENTIRAFFDTISQTDQLVDFAQQIGSTSSELQGLRFAAEQMGSSSGVLDNALQKMVQRIGEARAGAEGSKDAFEALGLNVDKLATMSSGEALKTIADKFKDIKNPADKAALAVDLFGKQGLNMVNMLSEGSTGIDAMIDRAKKLGAVLSDEDAAALAKAQDSINEFKAAWNGLWQQLTLLVMPVLVGIVEILTTIVGVVNTFTGAINNALKPLREFFGLTAQVTKATVGDGTSPTAEFKKRQQEAEAAKKEAAERQKKLDDMFSRGKSLAEHLRTPEENFKAEIADLQKLLSISAISRETFRRGLGESVGKFRDAQDKVPDLGPFRQTQGVAATTLSSTAGFSAVQAALRGDEDRQRRQEDRDKKSLDVQQRQLEVNKRIEDILKNSRPTGVDI